MSLSRMPAGEQYVTAREVADRVGLSPDTILRYYREGQIPGRRLPGQIRPVRFLWSEVEARSTGPRAPQMDDGGGRRRDDAQRGQIFRAPSGLWAIRYRDALRPAPSANGYRTRREAREALDEATASRAARAAVQAAR